MFAVTSEISLFLQPRGLQSEICKSFTVQQKTVKIANVLSLECLYYVYDRVY